MLTHFINHPLAARSIAWLKPKSYTLILLLIVVAGTVLRFWQLRTHLHFDIDEATHTNTIWGIWRDHNLIAQGPPASGDTELYHGAYYYYLYLIPAILAHGNPLGLAIFTIVLSIATIWILARATELAYGKKAALVASFIYMISYYAIIYSRWIWNPNSIPFFMTLSLLALILMTQGKKNYLVLFAFAVGSITQLHVGGLVFLPIMTCMIPLLLTLTRDRKLWALSTGVFLVPWLPTIYNELAHHYPLVRALAKMLRNPSHTSLIDHAVRGFDYLDFMFKVVTQQPHIIFLLVMMLALSVMILHSGTKTALRPLSWYIGLTLLFSFLVYSFYPGILYIHVSEHLFVLFPLLIGVATTQLTTNKYTIVALLVFLLSVAHLNWPLYVKDVVQGDAQIGTIKHICQIVRDNGDSAATIIFNKKENPISVTYICQTQFGINSPGGIIYIVNSNYKDQFLLQRIAPK